MLLDTVVSYGMSHHVASYSPALWDVAPCSLIQHALWEVTTLIQHALWDVRPCGLVGHLMGCSIMQL